MRFSPLLAELGTYPFAVLDAAKDEARARGVELIDFSIGDPREGADPFVREALIDALANVAGYPRAAGLASLRSAVADWVDRRFGVTVDSEVEIIPTLGAKEAIFSFAQVVVDPAGGKDLVVATEPGYPVAVRGARFAGAQVLELPLTRESGFLPDLDAVAPDLWRRTAVLWLNYPNNPTGACAPLALYERANELAERYDFLIASDEAYSEIYTGDAPSSALEVTERERIVVFNSLSKRSSMTGYRAGFMVCSAEVATAVKLFRPMIGAAPQEFVQQAAIAALGDESHVTRTRERYARKRELMRAAFAALGFDDAGGDATMFLWLATPAAETSDQVALQLLENGIVVTPGGALGASGDGYVRVALVPTESDCARAAQILEEMQ
ncbi:MAG: pyridoxal phosphate-dependent aminotransferase [Gaiellaceae bacterium]